MRVYYSDNKAKLDGKLLHGEVSDKRVELEQGKAYDIIPQVTIQESWDWMGASINYEDEPANFELVLNGEKLNHQSKFDNIGVVTVNHFPEEKRIYFAIEKPEGAAAFEKGLHELLKIPFRLVGYTLFIDIVER